MRLFKSALAAIAVLCLGVAPAVAADNLTVKDASAATVTMRSKDTGSGIQAPMNVLGDSSGTIIDPAKAVAGVATTTITRPADTTAYAANDTLADSTSAPTTGGFTLSSVCSASGKSGIIKSLVVVSSNDPATLLQGEVWIFDSAPTAVNDNAAFALSDADALKLVGVIPFALATTVAGSGTNSYFATNGLELGYTCSGSANLRYLVKVKNAYTPANAETLTVRVNFVGTN